MDDKTILEELLERSPDERMHKRKMDKAYHLMGMGMRDEADALFDEILAEEPYNRDALTGKKLIERQRAVESRMDSLTARARAALPEARQSEEHAARHDPKKNMSAREPRFAFLRSKKVKTALIALFALLVAAAAAFVATDGFGADETSETASDCVYAIDI